MAAIGVAAGTASAETVIGGVIGYGTAAFESYEVIHQCDHLLRLIGLTDSAVQVAYGQVGQIIGTSPDGVAGFMAISTGGGLSMDLPGGVE
ncbi:hypothetical protein GCM10010168_59720 [Actinoplanes ianthinogenes]|uniref:Uncharacterized protein n=1 Tax=Actinoplanes ianthinogenes TaxID=122358 RepID=A0ABN6CMI5_9ACTN|nr:hypothetical protein [Actinoplanes ianthinogenes]BCJ46333.1 hypothetical protein Aiant_69900 [Actinoplanes ianthinogenes]GGR33566.1 hypothetical protein GCM10010168_59720 [Actinoplanes ianthinogenes]